ncbi:MAG: N-acetyl-gamma-glutamyl-phosphate reductase [Cyanobacteriota bacterium]|nr:N-acetyl-gamma-glutamyl-phosphate reductase [Cyanobacteriota bacterium]
MTDQRGQAQSGEKVTVGIVGASGYGGVQLAKLLAEHPRTQITYLAGQDSAGKKYGELYPQLSQAVDLPILPVDVEQIAQACKVVFLSLPNGIAYDLAPALLAKGCQVLDLSADYRFRSLATYQSWYRPTQEGWPLPAHREANAEAVYGLPELYRDPLSHARLVGCPGCYPTASLLAVAPLLRQGLVEPDSLIFDAKSGVSGAGRAAKVSSLFAEVDSSFAAYGVAQHRHTPEIEQICSDLAHTPITVQFTPHLVPMIRGMHVTLYATLRDPGLVGDDLLTIYTAFYRQSPWVKLLPRGVYPQTKWVMGTNYCTLSLEVDSRTHRVIVLSVIDNLLKGQAGQAVQCLNLMMGWEETLGLPRLPFYP